MHSVSLVESLSIVFLLLLYDFMLSHYALCSCHLVAVSNDSMLSCVHCAGIVGVAWDWINRKLYWVDSENQTLEVIDPSTGYRKVLLKFENMERPRAIVLDPVTK